jgi:hypothetical protein
MIQQVKAYQVLLAPQIFLSQVLMYLCPLSNLVLLPAPHTIRAISMTQHYFSKLAQPHRPYRLQPNNFPHQQIHISKPHFLKIQ